MRAYTAEQMRGLDRCAIENYGIAGVVLMEVAGRAVARAVRSRLPSGHTSVVILCGGGNNGGDGFVAARHLLSHGVATSVWLVGDEARIKGDARTNLDVLKRLNPEISTVADDVQLSRARHAMGAATVIVDALLGTGLRDELAGVFRGLVEAANESPAHKIAVDVPTGLHADTGEVLGVVFAADETVTFGAPKVALVTYPGVRHVGDLHVVDIGIPGPATDSSPYVLTVLDTPRIRRMLKCRDPWGHKGTFGHLLIIAGSAGKSGAALLCGQSALRAGVGLCTIGLESEMLAVVEPKTREVMLASVCPADAQLDGGDRVFDHLGPLMEGKAAIALGPGMPRGDAASDFVARLVREAEVPIVIDADGINALASQTDCLGQAGAPVILTPHPGEFARLAGASVADVQRDRVGAARRFATTHGVYVALKGARTVVATPEGQVAVNPTGNSGMGTAGTGDVLTGLVGSLVAQGHAPAEAISIAVYAHGLAGDRIAAKIGGRALIAGDLVDEAGLVLSEWD